MEREQLTVDVLFVGAGPANLAAAYRLAKILEGQNREAEIMIIEKGKQVGDHVLSGAIMDPRGMIDLFGPDWADSCPIEAEVSGESVFYLTESKTVTFPIIPPTLRNHGNVIVSLSRVVAWMKEKVEELGVMVAEAFPGSSLLYDGDKVIGVRTQDMGLAPDGQPGPNFQPGTDIHAKITVLGEGSRGSLTKELVARMGLDGRNPQVYGTGCKEIWEIPEGRIGKGEVWHTAGWPLTNDQYGGSWVYALDDRRVSIGFVTALDGGDPDLDPWEIFQTWKTHPAIKALLVDGTMVKAGAKTVPEGGYWSRPRSYGNGFLILGDSGSLLNIARLKGIHTAIKSGELAGDACADALAADDFSEARLAEYERLFDQSWLKKELWKTRNYRASFNSGFWWGGFTSTLSMFLGGRLFRDPVPMTPDHTHYQKRAWRKERLAADGKLTFDKVTGVYHAGAVHEEQQPSHLLVADTDVCRTRCAEEFGNPCESFCPAAVYEMTSDGQGGRRLQINHSNCVHCKTCDIADPYSLITWTTPADAGGPQYMGM